jgi:uncharacterized protein YneF (UPF0154 family)
VGCAVTVAVDVAKLATDNAMVIIPVTVVLVLAGVLIGFFLRRRGLEQAVEELTEAPTFADKAARKVFSTRTATNYGDQQQAHALRSEEHARAVARVLGNDREAGDIVRALVFDHFLFTERVDARITHKEVAVRLELDLRFERLRSEFGAEMRAAVEGSQTAVFKKIDLIFDKLDELQRRA